MNKVELNILYYACKGFHNLYPCVAATADGVIEIEFDFQCGKQDKFYEDFEYKLMFGSIGGSYFELCFDSNQLCITENDRNH